MLDFAKMTGCKHYSLICHAIHNEENVLFHCHQMFAAMKLFFAQRLSSYSDTDPSIKSMAIVMLFVVFIIPGL
jgi:hypothetical protein